MIPKSDNLSSSVPVLSQSLSRFKTEKAVSAYAELIVIVKYIFKTSKISS